MAQRRVECSTKRGTVVAALRQRILDGALAPGNQLPSCGELVAEFAVSPVTAQQAVERLKQDGFVYGRQGAGVFVVDHPPHLTNYALAFYDNPHGGEYERFSRFFQALHAAAKGFNDEAARVMNAFYNCNGLCESPDYCRLTEEVYAQRVAGVIFTFAPHHGRLPEDSPLVSMPGLPRVAIASGNDAGIPCVAPDREGLLRQAVAHLASHGRKRIATLSHERSLPGFNHVLFEAMKAQGLPVVPYWHQYLDHLHPESAFNCAHLLFNPQQKELPDALFVTDDNLAEAAVAGVAAAGVRVPDEVEIVVHCNWPLPPKTVLPVTRIGFEASQLLDACIRVLDAQRAGKTPPPMTLVPAVMQENASA